MAEEGTLEERKERCEFDIYYEKRAKKILLICTAICGGLGLIGGIAGGISVGGGIEILAFIIVGLWFGVGFGGAISLIRMFIYLHKEAAKRGEENFSFVFTLIEFFVILFAGLLGLLIRILRLNHRIKKFEKRLSELG